MRSLAGQVAIITGASSGIGKAIATGLAAQGASVCLIGRKLAALESVAELIKDKAPTVLCYCVDLSNDQDVSLLKSKVIKDARGADLLIHSAGVVALNPTESSSIEDLDWQYRINFRAPYVLTQQLLPLIGERQGQIVFINSSAGLSTRANVGQYASTKHALKAFADSLREEVNTTGVRVLSVYVGRTATPMQEAIHKLEHRAYVPDELLQPNDVAEVVIHSLCLPLTAEVTDINIRPLKKMHDLRR